MNFNKLDIVIVENINILLIDNIDNVNTLKSSLIEENFNIFITESIEKALQICINNHISIAIVAIDIPHQNGFNFINKIKSNPNTQHIVVIFTIDHSATSEFIVKGLKKGAVDYLYKPFDLSVTIAKIHAMVTLVNIQNEIKQKNKELQESKEELFKAIDDTRRSTIIKENFLANMSHEIRTPLNAIIGLINLLKDSSSDNNQKKLIELMGFSSNALLGIVNDILESAKIDAGKVEIVRSKTDIVKLIRTISDLIKPMANAKGLNLTCEIADNTPIYIMADALRLNQILLNIINNAIKFTHKGKISIGLKPLEFTEDRVLLEFFIKDTGIGIPKASIKKIFTRFEQVEDKTWQEFGGTGLGLSIVKRLIELKGGNLHIESEVDKGTSFTFSNWYNLAEDLIPKQESEPNKQQDPIDEILILLVDDNPLNQFIVVEMLKDWNIDVDVANNGLEAFEKIKIRNYKLILMDTHMPVMNGNETTKKIRKELTSVKRNIPIISFSASVIENEKKAAKNAGVDDFMEKPFEPSLLVKKIRKLIAEHDKKNVNENIS